MISPSEIKVGIVAEQGLDIWSALTCLKQSGCADENVVVKYVPSFQLALGALFFAEYTDVDAVIILLEPDNSPEYRALLDGLMKLQIAWNMPITIGDCTAASEAIEMVAMQNEMEAAAPEHLASENKQVN